MTSSPFAPVPGHRNPLTLAPICAHTDLAVHAESLDAIHTFTFSGRRIRLSKRTGNIEASIRVLPRELPEYATKFDPGVMVRVYITNGDGPYVDRYLKTLVDAGWVLLGVAWHHEHHGRLGWLLFQSPTGNRAN